MIYPETLYNFFKTCRDEMTIAHVCMALGGQDVSLNETERVFVAMITNASQWMDDSASKRREHWAAKKRELRKKDGEKCPEDKKKSQDKNLSARQTDVPIHSDTHSVSHSVIQSVLKPSTHSPRADARGRVREGGDFERFWDRYGKKVGRANAERAFDRATRCASWPGIEIVLATVDAWNATPQWREEGGRYKPYAATWLNGERWTDSPEAADGAAAAAERRERVLDEMHV